MYPWGLHAHVFLNPDTKHPNIVDYDDAKQGRISPVLAAPEMTGTHTVEQYVQTNFTGQEGLRDLRVYNKVDVVTYNKPEPTESVEEYKILLLWQVFEYTITTAVFTITTVIVWWFSGRPRKFKKVQLRSM